MYNIWTVIDYPNYNNQTSKDAENNQAGLEKLKEMLHSCGEWALQVLHVNGYQEVR